MKHVHETAEIKMLKILRENAKVKTRNKVLFAIICIFAITVTTLGYCRGAYASYVKSYRVEQVSKWIASGCSGNKFRWPEVLDKWPITFSKRNRDLTAREIRKYRRHLKTYCKTDYDNHISAIEEVKELKKEGEIK